MRQIVSSVVVVASIGACVTAACLNSSNPPPAPPFSEDAGPSDAAPTGDSSIDAPSVDATLPGDASDASTDASPAGPPGEGGSPDAAPLVCNDAGTDRCLFILATNQSNPEAVTLHGGFLYWIEEGIPGRIQRLPLGGGPAQELVSGQQGSDALAVDDANIYWANQYAGTVYSAPNTGVPVGGSPTLIAAIDGGGPTAMVIDSTRVYWTDFNAGNVYAAPIGGISDGGSPSVLASAQGSPFALATDGTNLYWTNYGGGGVMALSLAGGKPVTIASGVSEPNQIAVTGGTVYFSSSAVDEIYAAPTTGITDGGPPSMFVAAGPTSTDSFVYDGTTVFWATSGNPGGEILSAPPGGTPTTLAVGLTSPGSLAFDATKIYWADFAYGTVFELAK